MNRDLSTRSTPISHRNLTSPGNYSSLPSTLKFLPTIPSPLSMSSIKLTGAITSNSERFFTNTTDDLTPSSRHGRSSRPRKDSMYVEQEDSTDDENQSQGNGDYASSDMIPSSPTGSAISDGDPPSFLAPLNLPLPSTTWNNDSSTNINNNGYGFDVKDEIDRSSGAGTSLRNFEELEDIVFATPDAFIGLAFSIAESLGMKLVITDDRTYKVTSAYMHVACVYRKSGCPFALKITKAKEGGWLMKTPRASDPKQRSVYKCRHSPSAVAEPVTEAGLPISSAKKNSVGRTGGTSTPSGSGSKKRSGGRKEPASAKREKKEDDVEGRFIPSREPRPVRARTSLSEGGGKSVTSSLQNYSPGSPSHFVVSEVEEDAPRVVYLNPPGNDRALAPPFERSVSLQSQIAPVLQQGQYEVGPDGRPFIVEGRKVIYLNDGQNSTSSFGGGRLSFPPSNPSAYQQLQQLQQQQQHLLQQQNPLAPQGYRGSFLPTAEVAPSPSLPRWTTFLTLLDPELITFAKMLASPSLAVSPESFFREDEEMRMALIDSLSEMPTWPRLLLKNKVKARGVEVWKIMEEMEVERKSNVEKGKAAKKDGAVRSDSAVSGSSAGEDSIIVHHYLGTEASSHPRSTPSSVPAVASSTITRTATPIVSPLVSSSRPPAPKETSPFAPYSITPSNNVNANTTYQAWADNNMLKQQLQLQQQSRIAMPILPPLVLESSRSGSPYVNGRPVISSSAIPLAQAQPKPQALAQVVPLAQPRNSTPDSSPRPPKYSPKSPGTWSANNSDEEGDALMITPVTAGTTKVDIDSSAAARR